MGIVHMLFPQLISEIVSQNSQLLTSWQQGIKHSIQGSEHPPIQPWKTQADCSPWGECTYQGPRPYQPLQVTLWSTSWLRSSCLQPVQTLKDQRSHTITGRTSLLRGGPLSTASAPLGKLLLPKQLPQHFPHKSTTFLWVKLFSIWGAAEHCPGTAKAGGSRVRPRDLPPSLLWGSGSSLMATEQGWMQPAHLATSWSSHKFKLN